MKQLFILLMLLTVITSASFAAQTSIVGGLRNGLALGVVGQQWMSDTFSLRYGIEGCTGNEGLICMLGGKFLMSYSGRSPIYLGLGLVEYFGASATGGFSMSVIVERLFDAKPLFLECGADMVANSLKLQLQLGYKL